MSTHDSAAQVAAVALADAILAEYNDSSSKLKGFSAAVIEKIAVYEKSLQVKVKSKDRT
jgi:hypothetical protein